MEFINKIPVVIRWGISLPVAILCGWLARWLALTLYYLWNGIDTTDWWPFILGTTSEAFAFVYSFYYIVPTKKLLASIVVSAAWGGISLFLLIMLLMNSEPLSSKLYDIITGLTNIIILTIACVLIYKQEADLTNKNQSA